MSDAFEHIELNNRYGQASAVAHGGHVLSYQPAEQEPVLWLSDLAVYQEGKAIRGGIPVCFPWFGPHPKAQGVPAHGTVRTTAWQFDGVSKTDVGEGTDEDQLGDTAMFSIQTDTEEGGSWLALLSVTLGPTLTTTLTVQNTGQTEQACSMALHTYLTVGDVQQINVTGLEQATYVDQLDDMTRKVQDGPICFAAETDRVYLDTPQAVYVNDPGLNRTIAIAKQGSQSTVVWNPWTQKASGMGDFPNDGWPGMVCIETANAMDNTLWLAPQVAHTMSTQLSVLPLNATFAK